MMETSHLDSRRISAVMSLALVLILGCRGERSTTGDAQLAASASTTAGSRFPSVTAPPCDDLEVQLTLLDLFESGASHDGRSDDELLSIGAIREIGFTSHASGPWSETRRCSAVGSASHRETAVWYEIVMPREEDGVGYRVKPCFAPPGDPQRVCADHGS